MNRKNVSIWLLFVALCIVCSQMATGELVGWWKFNEGGGSTVFDSSGHGHNGTRFGTTAWTQGYIDAGALSITSGGVNIPDSAQLRPSRITVCIWAYLSVSQQEYARLLEKGNDNNETYNFQISGQNLHFGMCNVGGVAAQAQLPIGDWFFVTGVYDGDKLLLYINGDLDNSSTVGSHTPCNSDGELLVVGNRPPDMDRPFNGLVDDVQIYNTGFSASEIWALYAWQGSDPNTAALPNPRDAAEDVSPYVQLSWLSGLNAASHDVYFGTDFDDVNDANHLSSEYKGNYEPNYYDPCALEFGLTYYWLIDEVNGLETWQGRVWSFTVLDGKAVNPWPSHNMMNVATDANLTWTAGEFASSHDVYLGTDFDEVNDANILSTAYKTTLSLGEESYDPDPLDEGVTYYWRIDENGDVGTAKGDIWSFQTRGGNLVLQVDLAVPTWSDKSVPIAGSAKPGWSIWASERWADMYMHDRVWFPSDDWGNSPDPYGIDGSGVHVLMTTGGEGQLGVHVRDMCRGNLAGDTPPTGSPIGDPIANSWAYAVDWAGEQQGDILLVLTGLPRGAYELHSFHNHWEPCTQSTRNCMRCVCAMPPMPSVTAQSLPPGPPPGWYCQWGLPPGTGQGVVSIENAYNVAPQHVLNDDELVPSIIKFATDGSEVWVRYEAGSNDYPDCARPGREGSRGILNAFIIIQLGTGPIMKVSSNELNFECSVYGPNPAAKTLNIENLGEEPFHWIISSDCNWVQAVPAEGNLAGGTSHVTISIDSAGLGFGEHSCLLTVSDTNDAINSPRYVTVNLSVRTPVLNVVPKKLSFIAPKGGPNPTPKSFSIKNTDIGILNWVVTEDCGWLSVSPASGQSSGEVDNVVVNINTDSLEEGEYSCVLTISDPNALNSPQYVTVALDVMKPEISVEPASFDLTYIIGPVPEPVNLSIFNSSLGILNWQITEDCNWLEVLPVSGVSSGDINEVLITIDVNELDIGDHNCVLTISDPNASNSPVTVSVRMLHVGSNRDVPSEYSTIQSAIDDSKDGETIIVADGIFKGPGNRDIDFLGKAITLISANGPNNCIIDCNSTISEPHRGFTFLNMEEADTVLQGFTVTNATSGISFFISSASISDCILTGNHDSGIELVEASEPNVTNCLITGTQGYGVLCDFSVPIFTNCLITENLSDGFYCDRGFAVIVNCGIVNNGGFGLSLVNRNRITVNNSIFRGNVSGEIQGVVTVTYSNIEGGYSGTGNIDDDPCFADAAGGDFHLLEHSPCIDVGDPCSDFGNEPEPDGGRINMGAYGNTPEATCRYGLVLESYNFVSKNRVGRTEFDYVYTMILNNNSTVAAADVLVELLDVPDNISVLDGEVSFGSIGPGVSAVSDDTFTLRVDRSQLIDTAVISWRASINWEGLSGDAEKEFSTRIILETGELAGDFTGDRMVNLKDFAKFAQQWSEDSSADIEKLLILTEHWLEAMAESN